MMYILRTCSSRCHKEAIPVCDTLSLATIHMHLYILQLPATTMDSNSHAQEDEPTNNTKACSPDHESQPKEGSMFCALVLYSKLL